MELSYRRCDVRADRDSLVIWLSSDSWPFHGQPQLTAADVYARIASGTYDPPDNQMYWIRNASGEAIGLLHLFDLCDIGTGSPGFDLRIRTTARGKGIGIHAVNWLSSELFTRHLQLQRISATTRVDNVAMRSVLAQCGYAKEGHFRQAWPAEDGRRLDSVEYSILRSDWESSTVTPVDWAT